MAEPVMIGSLFGSDVYIYGICAAASVLCGCLFCVWLAHKRLHSALVGLRLALYAVPLCLVTARLGYCLVRASFIAVDYVPGFVLRLNLGGYSLAGGSIGLLLAVWIVAKLAKHPFAALMDVAVPAALVTLAGLRFAEAATLNGVGAYMDNEALCWFPLAVQNTYGEYVLPVFFWEGLTALILAIVLIARPKIRVGDVALSGAMLLGLTQVFWESLRADDFLRFGFVRVNQLWGLLLAFCAIGVWLARAAKPFRQVLATAGVCVLCTGLMTGVMFGLDKLPIPNEVLYGVLLCTLAALGALGLRLSKQDKRGGSRPCA